MLCKNNKTPAQIVCEWVKACARRDGEAAFAMLSDDLKRRGDPDWIPWTKPQYRAMWSGFIEAFPDFKWEITNYVESGNMVVMEMIESGTFTVPYPRGGGKSVPPTNKAYKDWDCAWFEVNDDGLITEIRAYLTNNFARTYNLVDPGEVANQGALWDEK
jgi:hypothetical protein